MKGSSSKYPITFVRYRLEKYVANAMQMSKLSTPFLKCPQLIDALRGLMYTSSVSLLESRVHAKGRVSCSVDVRELFAGGALAREWRADLVERLQSVKVVGLGVRHSFEVNFLDYLDGFITANFIQKEIAPSTTAIFVGKMNQGADEDDPSTKSRSNIQGNVVGTIIHQYSPSIKLQVSSYF